MSLNPKNIEKNIKKIGISEANALLIEWINNSSDLIVRKDALKFLSSIDNGKNYDFLEHLFLAEESLELRRFSGDILIKNYKHHKKIAPLLQFILKEIKSVDQKYLAATLLNTLGSRSSRLLVRDFLRETIKERYGGRIDDFPVKIFDQQYDDGVTSSILDLAFNIIHSGYIKKRDNKIIFFSVIGGNLTNISDIGKLKVFSDLEHLILERNGIKHISGLESLKKLKVLNLNGNNIKTIEGVSELTYLTELDVSGNKVEHISGVEGLQNLRKLYLNENLIKDIGELNSLTGLEELNLSGNQISRIENLSELTSLKRLNLSFNEIKDIKGLDNLKNLLILNLNDNNISNMKGLQFLQELRFLNLSNNRIGEISNLDNQINLSKLILTNNNIRKIKGLKNLLKLTELYLDRNKIKVFEGLDNLASLIILFLSGNYIFEFSAKHVEPLTSLNFIFLNDNQLSKESLDAYNKFYRFI